MNTLLMKNYIVFRVKCFVKRIITWYKKIKILKNRVEIINI